MDLSRRDFLSATAVSSAALLLPEFACVGPDDAALASPSLTWSKAPCRFCGTGCGLRVGVEGGKIRAIQGDPKNPVNKGLLCVKGYHAGLALYGADRLTKPRIRKNGVLVESTWDEALDLVAAKFKETLAAKGPAGVGFYGSGQWTIPEGYAALKLMKAGIGSDNVEANARLCMASAVAGFMTTFGSDEPMGCYDDFEKADRFVLFGANMAEMHPVLFSRMLERRRLDPTVKIVELGTRTTPTSEAADVSLLFWPQTDLAIANCIAHQLVANGKVDRAFVEKHVVFKAGKTAIGYGTEDKFAFKDEPGPMTFDAFAKFVADYPVEKVAKLSGVSEAALRDLAEIYGNPDRKVVTLWCMGVNQHTRGTWMNNLLNNLHLLTGKIGANGSNPFSLTGQPSACGTVREVGTAAGRLPADMVIDNPEHRKIASEIWGVADDRIPKAKGLHAVEMFRAFDRGDVGLIWVQVTNPFQTLPNVSRFRKAAEKRHGFLIVSDVYPTRTTELADVVLPSALWVEKAGLFGNSERRTQQWDRLVDPPGEARSDVWQIVEVAKRLGHGELFRYGTTEIEKELYEEYRKFGLGHGKDLASYEELQGARGMRWPVVKGVETDYRYVEGHDPYVKPGEGLRFYKNKATDGKAVVWARPYEPPPESPDAAFPFWLSTGRVLEHWHSGTLTRRIEVLHRAVPATYCEIHPNDAKVLGLVDGDRVRVISRRGQFETVASIGGRGTPQAGLVFVPFFDDDVMVNLSTLDAYCPISAQPDYKKCAVRLEKA